jgi:hypothetical protein
MVSPPPTSEPPPPRRISPVVLGALVALIAGALIAWLLTSRGSPQQVAPPASEAGLVVESTGEEGGIDPARPLRCFVAGQFVGELTLAACAQRNGVATDALDVGIDQTGALAAAPDAGPLLTPLPPVEEVAPEPEQEVSLPEVVEPSPEAATAGSCWRHGGGRWRKLPGDMDLNACVQALFQGRCEREGRASYGRWGQETLRLVAGGVEISDDNQSFRTLANQGANCSLPPVG